jgi:thioredoxin reductase (NADPH)
MAEKIIIIGSGPAGLSAAIYASREGFEPLVIGGSIPGGQLLLTTVVENYPGFPQGVDGPQLIEDMRKQAEKFGTRFVYEDAGAVDFTKKPFKVSAGGRDYEAECVIIATGANAKWLGIPSEKKFIGHGVSNCATCDGAFYKGKDVIAVGGGDTAMEDSTFLTRFANSVTIVHRKDSFRASKVMQDRVMSNPKIKVIWNTVIDEILGDAKVTGDRLKDALSNKVTEMKIDGIFVAIGYNPNTSVFKGTAIKLDEMGYIVPSGEEIHTGIDGVFVAGDVADRTYRQAATASGSGVKAALAAREYLQNLESAAK